MICNFGAVLLKGTPWSPKKPLERKNAFKKGHPMKNQEKRAKTRLKKGHPMSCGWSRVNLSLKKGTP